MNTNPNIPSSNATSSHEASSVHPSHGVNTDHLKNLKNDPAYSLTGSERALMRTRLEEISRTPISALRPVPSSWFVFSMRPMPLAALALIVTISTGSVSLAAGGALPGDVLYGVKVHVNENVELALSPGTEAKANTRVRHAEERLKETEILAVQGELTEEVAASAAVAVAENVDAAVEAAEELKEEGDAAAATSVNGRIASALLAHAELLDAHSENFEDGSRNALQSLARAANEVARAASVEVTNDAAATDDTEERVVAEAAHDRARAWVEDLAKRIDKNGVALETESAFTDEYTQLSSDLVDSEAYLIAGEYQNAVQAYEEIDRRAYRALTFLMSAQRIGDKTDMEVVVAFVTEDADAMTLEAAAPVALRAKSAAEPEVATMSLIIEATTTADVSQETMVAPAPEATTLNTRSRGHLEFRLRDQVED